MAHASIKRIEVQLSVHEEVAGNRNVASYRRSKSKHVSPAAEQSREGMLCCSPAQVGSNTLKDTERMQGRACMLQFLDQHVGTELNRNWRDERRGEEKRAEEVAVLTPAMAMGLRIWRRLVGGPRRCTASSPEQNRAEEGGKAGEEPTSAVLVEPHDGAAAYDSSPERARSLSCPANIGRSDARRR